jgi:hypothetical protein
MKKSNLELKLKNIIAEVLAEQDIQSISEIQSPKECQICGKDMGMISDKDFEQAHGHCNDDTCRSACQTCAENPIDEVSVTGGVDAPASKMAFGKVKDRVARQAGYTPVGIEESKLLTEDIDYNVKQDYDAYMAQVLKSKAALEAKLNKMLAGKKVVIRAKKGVKTGIFVKNYDVEVTSVQIDDSDVVIKGKDGKSYFLDKNYTIKVVQPAAAQPAAQAPAPEQPAEPAAKPAVPAPEADKKDLSKEINK